MHNNKLVLLKKIADSAFIHNNFFETPAHYNRNGLAGGLHEH